MGAGLTVEEGRVMRGENNAKFGEKRRLEKLSVGDKKGEETDRR